MAQVPTAILRPPESQKWIFNKVTPNKCMDCIQRKYESNDYNFNVLLATYFRF